MKPTVRGTRHRYDHVGQPHRGGAMLPYRDRHALRKIGEELRASDPAFAETLSTGGKSAEARRWKVLLVLSDVTVALMVLVGLLTNSTSLFLWGMVALAAVVWAHKTAARTRQSGRPRST